MESIRLFDVNVYDEKKAKVFVMQFFGLNEKGDTFCLYVKDFKPFFYAKVPDTWTRSTMLQFLEYLRVESTVENNLIDGELVSCGKMYGYDNNKQHSFIRIRFENLYSFNKVKNLWYDSNKKERILKKTGLVYRHTEFIELYESHIPPLLRMYHLQDISPSGWIHVNRTCLKQRSIRSTTTCTYEGTVKYKEIYPDNEKESIVPYKICSFDIEADSSHGDFPLPVKTFKKLSMEIIGYLYDKTDAELSEDLLLTFLQQAFGCGDEAHAYPFISIVYTKQPISQDEVVKAVDRLCKENVATVLAKYTRKDDTLIQNSIMQYFQSLASDADADYGACQEDSNANQPQRNDVLEVDGHGHIAGVDDDEDTCNMKEQVVVSESALLKKNIKRLRMDTKVKKSVLLEYLNDGNVKKEEKIDVLDAVLSESFDCGVHGDKITFIGSVFFRYGEKDTYRNHCIALNECDSVEGVEIESYDNERDVLLAWTRLIQAEDPDIIIGYNIFGFDYEYMFRRSLETDCVMDFLKLSRTKSEVCVNYTRDGGLNIADHKIVIASGEHNLHYIKMTGRLQVDLLNTFRRDYNLELYKLDYVAGDFIGDKVKRCVHESDTTKIYSGNLLGLYNDAFVTFEITEYSSELYNNGEKFAVCEVNAKEGTFCVRKRNLEFLNGKRVKWGLAKDDISPQEIFQLTRQGSAERSLVAKYCVQDCRLPMHLFNKTDMMTGFSEMAKLCSVPISFIVMRGQGIKLTSYIAKKCMDKNILIPTIEKSKGDEAYEGAIVLEPKCALYLDNPIACVDYGSLYPSSMISENISHDTKVFTKEYNLNGKMICMKGEENEFTSVKDYVDITYDVYKWIPNIRGKSEKQMVGTKTCRYVQPNYETGERLGIIPACLKELLAARKATRKRILTEKDDFMKNILDKRQLSIKVTANSIYGQCGAKTSTFYDMDVAASTTATGRKLLMFAKRTIEDVYKKGTLVETESHGTVMTDAECVYGDTDSAFVSFHLKEKDGRTPITGKKALAISIEIAQKAGAIVTRYLKPPHDLEYEKTFLPFCLLSKKRYVGMLYETDVNKCFRKSMGIVLKRRDNAPIVKDVYGGIIDILMNTQNIGDAVSFLNDSISSLIAGKYPMQKLVITKSLRSNYANPKQIAHKVLADRIAERDPGNARKAGDRIGYVHILVEHKNKAKPLLMGDKIELPEVVISNNLEIDYEYYLTNQIMKPIQQMFALVLEDLRGYDKEKLFYKSNITKLYDDCENSITFEKKKADLRGKIVKRLLFDTHLRKIENKKCKRNEITNFFTKVKP